MGSITIRDFHDALNAVSQPLTKQVGYADAMENVIVSTRNTVAKKPGHTPINSVAYGGGEEILSIFDYLLQQGDIVRSTIFQQGTNLYHVHHPSGVAGVIKSGLTPQEFQYTVSGSTVYMGNRKEMLKYYAIAGYATFANFGWNITDIYDQGRSALAQGFKSLHLNPRNCASIIIPMQRVGTISSARKVTLSIHTDNGGEPSVSPIANGTSNQIDGSDITPNWAWTAFTFGATLPILTPGVQYWAVLEVSGNLAAPAVINWATDTTNPVHPDGNFSVNDGGWVDQPTTVASFHVFVEPDLWGIEAPTTAPDVAAPAVNNPAYDTEVDQDADEELVGLPALSAELAQSWEFTGEDERTVNAVTLYLKKTGLPLGALQVVIRNDVDGRPSAATLMSFPTISMETLTGAYQFITFTANDGDEITLSPNTKYWLHLSGSYTYLDEFVTGVTSVSWGVDASAPTFTTGEFARVPGVQPWDVDPTIDALFRIISTLSSAGGRRYSYSWKNSVTGHVSNPSPASVRSNGDSVTVDNFEIPTDPQIDLLILWATTDGGEIFFQLDEQPEETVSIVDGPVSEDDLDFTVEAPFCNFPPPIGNVISRAKDSIIVSGVRTNRHRAFYSAGLGQTLVGVPEESFPAFNFVGVPGGSEPIYNIDSIDGNPVIFTTDQIFTIAGETPESFRAQEMRGGKGIGSVSKRGSVATEVGLFFMSTDRKVYILPTISHIPQLISEIVEDAFENITDDSALLQIRAMEKVRMEYLAYADRHWVVLAIATGASSDVNNELWMYDIDLHNNHSGRGWMGPLINDGAEGFQSLKVVTDSAQTKTLFFGTDGGFISKLGVGNQDDGVNFTSSVTFPFMDDNKPNTVKDWLTVEIIVPAGQTVPSNFLQVSYDSETDFVTIPLVQVNEMERGASDHKYRGYLMRQSTRIKPRINFAVEDAVGELWQLRLDYNDLYETIGLIHDANA